MEGEEKHTYENLNCGTAKEECIYELCQVSATEERRPEEPKNIKKRKNKELTTWNKPIIIIIVLLSLIVILQVGILCLLLAHMSTRDTTCTAGATTGATTGATAGNNGYPNFTQWANDIVNEVNSNVTGSLPDFNEWANGVVSKVNSNVTGSLPDFNEWANGVVSKVNSNVTGDLPDFNEWANGVISKVNSNVTGSLPDFNEWANGVVSKVNSNVTGDLPDFNEWANGVISKVNSNVTGSLPDFNEWANGVVSKVNSNVTGSLPDFNEWANGVVSKVNSNVTGSLPDFNEWANGVVSKVNSNVTGSLPDFNEWANGVVSKVNSNVTGSLPDFNEWANGVVSKVNSNVTGSLPDFNEWANGVVSKVNSNVTGSLPDFNEWANGVVSKVNSNVTGSLPDFNEWANGVVSKVNSNVTGDLPDFNEWANGVISKVNSNVTGSLPDFNEWANGVVSKVNSNVTGSLPDFNEWANGVSQNTLQLFQNSINFTEVDKQILQTTKDSAQKLINIVNTLSNLQDTSTSTAGVTDDILLIVLQWLVLLENDSLSSCKELKSQYPSSPSGYYVLASANGSATYTAYCNMDELCGSGGGWTRLAYLDMSDATQNCPSGFRLYQSGGVRVCGRTKLYASCVSVQFPSNGISYSQICGRVTGYQYGNTNGIDDSYRDDLNSYYLEGVSITRGSPRQHVWSLIAGNSELTSSSWSCPCNTGSLVSVQSFIGNNYYCESGNNNTNIASQNLYTSDPLWDGQGCGSLESPCCNVPGIPWFHRDYGSNTTTDYIELRVCGDGGVYWEDNPVSYYEIYVK